MVTDVSAFTGRVRVRRQGSFGVLPSQAANALAMVLTELLQNAVEHGYDDADPAAHRHRSCVGVEHLVGRMHVVVDDDGRGLPEGFSLDGSTNLGLSIVRTLVESELGGQLEHERGARAAGPGSRSTCRTWPRSRRARSGLRRCGRGPGRCGA